MQQNIHDFITRILQIEGSQYTNKATDAGGPTKYGVTLETLKAHRGNPNLTASDVALLEEAEAREIYTIRFWSKPKFHLINPLSNAIAFEMLDIEVNMKAGIAALFLQRALNCFNKRGKLYFDIEADGEIGEKTVLALRAYLTHRGVEGEQVMLTALNSMQGARYIERTEDRPDNEDYVYGWFRERVKI